MSDEFENLSKILSEHEKAMKRYKEEEKAKEEKEERRKQRFQELDLHIGDRIRIIEPSEETDRGTDYRTLLGMEAIIIDEKDYFSFRYRLHFLDKKLNTNITSVDPFYLEKLGPDPETYQSYLDELERVRTTFEFQYGSCPICGTGLSFYGRCRRCVLPQPMENFHGAFDFLTLLDHTQAIFRDQDLKIDDLWMYFNFEKNFPNDSYQYLTFHQEPESNIKDAIDYIKKMFLNTSKHLFVWVSW